MIKRLLTGCVATALALLIAHQAYEQREPAWRIAQQMAGEYWYRLTLDEHHIGYLTSRSGLGPGGRIQLHSDLRFAMQEDAPVQIVQGLQFAAGAPHRLIYASYNIHRPDSNVRVEAQADPQRPTLFNVAVTERSRGQDSAPQTEQVRWDFSLADYLKVESWLANAHPAAGDSIRSHSLDLEKLRLTQKEFAVIERSGCCFRLRNSALHADTQIELDTNFVPRRMHLAGLFELQRSNRQEALAPRSRLTQASYRIPLNQRLPAARSLTRLLLAPQGVDKHLWPPQLELRADAISNPAPPQPVHVQSTLTHPAAHPKIAALLSSLNLPRQTLDQVAHLREFVHSYLRYEPRSNPATVLSLLDQPSGDCSEYADLFTSLARAAGIPARTVFGLAYSDEQAPGLGFHAWNEVYVDDRWHSVDPTWNQQPIDATHLHLPAADATALRLLTGQSELTFDVLDTSTASGA